MGGIDIPLRRDRRGIALALVLWALVIGAALLTLGLLITVQEQRGAAAERRLEHGLTDSEAGLVAALDGWTPGALRLLLPGSFDSMAIGGTLEAGGLPWRGTLRRLSPALFFVEVTVDGPREVGNEPLRAQVRLGQLVRTRVAEVAPLAALSVAGAAVLGIGAEVDGRDTNPPGRADCPPPDPDSAVAGVAAGAVSLAPGSAIDGSPPVTIRLPSEPSAFDALASAATVTVPGGTWTTLPATVGTACDVSAPANWGAPSDPLSPCWNYLPIIHVRGDLTLAAGEGQGILLVDGDLTVIGSYRFYGLVSARGRLSVAGSGARATLTGTVEAGSVGSPSEPAAELSVKYSKCMFSNALLSSGVLVPLFSRSWKQLFSTP
jgi:hypothetical protein